MDNIRQERIVLTVVLTIIEGIISYILYANEIIRTDSWWIVFLSYVTPVGFLCFLNYNFLSPICIYIALKIWEWTGHFQRVSKQFNIIAEKCIAWLNGVDSHWGVVDTAEECQNANTCEVLLAIKSAKLDQRYKTIYYDALNEVLNNTTYEGLPSKSLQHETVVCTSMILYLYSLERKTNTSILRLEEKFNNIANTLWNARSNMGWGVFIEKTRESDCSIANTFWALRALNEYGFSQDNDYINMLRRIYERSTNSLFGYVAGDTPRLCTTAMSAILYYHLEDNARNAVKEVYDVKKAVQFIYKMFCCNGIECELEVLQGLEIKSNGAKKAPWTHVTIEFATEALVSAYRNKDLNLMKMNNFIRFLKKTCKKRLVFINGNDQYCYYIPKDMVINKKGIYTFPTAYIAWALSLMDF